MGINRAEVRKEKGMKIFLCYAREDEELCRSLEKHLKALQRQGIVHIWSDGQISAGTEWEREIRAQLDAARIILLLISPDFMVSDYCYGNEMQRAMERHHRAVARVIPILLRPVYFQDAPFGNLQILPTNATPITDKKWSNLDEAFDDVIKGIIAAIEEITAISSASAPEILPPLKDSSSEVVLSPPSAQESFTELPSPVIDAALLSPRRLSQRQTLEPDTSRRLNQYGQADLATRRVPQSASTGYPSASTGYSFPFRRRWVFLLTYGTIAGIIQALVVLIPSLTSVAQLSFWFFISAAFGPPFIAGLIARITLRTGILGFIPGFISGIILVIAFYIYLLLYANLIVIGTSILYIIGAVTIEGLVSLLGTGFAVLVSLPQKFLPRLF